MERSYSTADSLEFSVVIPVYNEEDNVEELYKRLSKTLSDMSRVYEIIFVDDGSSDRTPSLLRDLFARDPHLKIILLTRNFGQHLAITAGFHTSRGELVILMDGDLQDQPEEIPKLIDKLREGYDVVYGLRKERKDTLCRRVSSGITVWVMEKMLGDKVQTNICTFRVMKRRVIKELNKCDERSRFLAGLISWLGFSHCGVEVIHGRRKEGESHYTFFSLIMLFMDMVTSFSYMPLRMASLSGIFIALIGFMYGASIAIKKVTIGIDTPGYTSIFVAIMIFFGIQLIFLGLIGEYVGRIYAEAQKRPLYVIDELLSSGEDNNE